MRPLRSLLCAAALALASCETQPTHEVLALTDLTPRQVEPGDRVVFHATGLPLPQDIRRMTLRLSGNLARPGVGPCARPVTLTLVDPPEGLAPSDYVRGVEGESYASGAGHTLRIVGGTRLEVFLDAAMIRTLSRCPGEAATADATHATLSLTGPHGGASLRVETVQGNVLASARALRGPTLDLHTDGVRSLTHEIAARTEAERVLGSLGIQLASAHPVEGGLQVDRVTPGSNAERAGITDGDVLVRLDGVTLLTVGDFRPPHGADRAVISLRRGDAVDDHPIRLTAVTRGVPTDLVATGVILLVAFGLLLLARRGTPTPFVWLTDGGARTLPGTRVEAAPSVLARWRASLRNGELPLLEGARGREDAVLLGAAIVSLALAVPFGQLAFSLDPDAAVTHLGLAIVATGFPVLRAWRGADRNRARAALIALSRRAIVELLALLSLASLVTAAGALHLQAIVASQGAAPWAWNLLRDPARVILGLAYLAPLALAAEDEPDGVVERAARWTVTVLRSVIAAAVLLGGWCVPGVAHLEQDASVSLQMLGVLLLLAKTWGVVALLRVVGPAMQRFHPAQRTRFALRVALPWTVAAAVLQMAALVAATRVSWVVANVSGRILGGATAALVGLVVLGRLARHALSRRGVIDPVVVVGGPRATA